MPGVAVRMSTKLSDHDRELTLFVDFTANNFLQSVLRGYSMIVVAEYHTISLTSALVPVP